MPDLTSLSSDAAPGWREAFAALPQADPPADGWAAVARKLDARRRARRWALPLAAAAALALAVVPAWLPQSSEQSPATRPVAATLAAGDSPIALAQLQAESARLEALLRYARDGRVASGAAAVMAAEFDARTAAVDAALMQPGLDPARRTQLWRERVEVLRAFAGFESTRRWLAASGERYDGALVRVD